MLTGEDLIRGEKKHRDSFIFTNHAKLLYSANELPRSEDTTDAFFRRWILVKFPYVFEGENCDPKKLDSLRSEEELSGLLNWALEGLTRIIKQGGFSMTQSRDSIKDEWIMQTDSLKAFVDKCVKTDADGLITKDFFYDSYTDFCDEYDLTPEDKALVGRRLPTILPGVKVRRVGPRGNRSRAWVGLVIEQENELDGGIVGGDGKTTHMGKQETLRDSSVHKVHDFSHLSQKKYSNTYILSDVDTGLHGHKDTIMDTPTPLNFWAFLNDCIKPDELIEKELLIVDAGEKGYTPEFVEDCLEKFKLEGRVYEPKAGFFKLIK